MAGAGLSIETLNRALSDLFAGRTDDFTLDAEGMVGLAFGDDVEVLLQADDARGVVVATTPILRITPKDPTLLKRALQLNHFALAPIDAFLALDDSGSSLLLCRVGRADLAEASALGDFLAELVAGATATRRRLVAGPAVEGAGTPALWTGDVVLRG